MNPLHNEDPSTSPSQVKSELKFEERIQSTIEVGNVKEGSLNQSGNGGGDLKGYHKPRKLNEFFQKVPKRAFGIFGASLTLCILFLLHPFWEKSSGIAKEIFITLTVVAGIHVLDRILLFRDTEEALERLTGDIENKSVQHHQVTQEKLTNVTEKKLAEVTSETKDTFKTIAEEMSGMVTKVHDETIDLALETENRLKDVTGETTATFNEVAKKMSSMVEKVHDETIGVLEQTKSYVSQVSESLSAMTKVGVNKLYSSREQAGADMLKDLTVDAPAVIRLMGISLNDFVQGKGESGAFWNSLKNRVKTVAENHSSKISNTKDYVPSQKDTILLRLLIIHPYCLGAQLRSIGESRGTDAIDSRLMTDVLSVGKEIEKLQKFEAPTIKIECKLYHLPPTLFLCSVQRGSETSHKSSVCYMQPYFFWNKRQDMPVPCFKFITDNTKCLDDQIPHQLNEHFDLIWNKASVTLADFRSNNIVGVDRGMCQAGALNVFLEKSESRQRILKMLKNAKTDVWIQGISLQSFFSPGDIYQEIIRLVLRGDVRIRVLVIDPECDQAKVRSFRERLFVAKDETLQSYGESERFKESALFRDTMTTIHQVTGFMKHLIDEKSKEDKWRHNFQIRKYHSAPACFMLRVDDRVLVEQYHYGKARQHNQPEMDVAILGKEMPVIEFTSTPEDLYETSPEVNERKPFRLLEDHFMFAFSQGEEILSEEILSKCSDRW